MCELTGLKPASAIRVTAGMPAPATKQSIVGGLSMNISVRAREFLCVMSLNECWPSLKSVFSFVAPRVHAKPWSKLNRSYVECPDRLPKGPYRPQLRADKI